MHDIIKRYAQRKKFVAINNLSLLAWRNMPNSLREALVETYYRTHRNRMPEIPFVVFAQGRSGSTLLVDLLNSHPDVSCLGEIFDGKVIRNVKRPVDFAAGLCCLATKRACGFKVAIYQITGQGLKPAPVLESFHRQGWRIIYLKRTDVLRHAISDIKSEKTRMFHNVDGNGKGAGAAGEQKKVAIAPRELFQTLRFRERCLELEKKVLEGIPHHIIEYEQDLMGEENQAVGMDRVFEFLGLSAHRSSTGFKKVTSPHLSDVLANYDEIRQALAGTRYEPYLEWTTAPQA